MLRSKRDTEWGPPCRKESDGEDKRDSSYYLSCDGGKMFMTLNICRSQNQEIVRALMSKCDVLIENYHVGTPAHYGLSYGLKIRVSVVQFRPWPPFPLHAFRLVFGLAFCVSGGRYTESPEVGIGVWITRHCVRSSFG